MENKKKTIKAVAPFAHLGFLNFKQAPFAAWVRNGGAGGAGALSSSVAARSGVPMGAAYDMEE